MTELEFRLKIKNDKGLIEKLKGKVLEKVKVIPSDNYIEDYIAKTSHLKLKGFISVLVELLFLSEVVVSLLLT